MGKKKKISKPAAKCPYARPSLFACLNFNLELQCVMCVFETFSHETFSILGLLIMIIGFGLYH